MEGNQERDGSCGFRVAVPVISVSFAQEIPYTSISGSVISEEDTMLADLTLKGGPAESIEFAPGSEQMQSREGFAITVTVNGSEMDLQITDDVHGFSNCRGPPPRPSRYVLK